MINGKNDSATMWSIVFSNNVTVYGAWWQRRYFPLETSTSHGGLVPLVALMSTEVRWLWPQKDT